jgi:Ala-tRNA(Pro) deacylase
MGIAISLKDYLEARHVAFECVTHRPTMRAIESAAASHISADRIAKAVVLRHRDGYVMTVLPASRNVNIDDVGNWLHQPVALATEQEIAPLFPDCAFGAIPPLGAAYGIETLIDSELDEQDDIYFEAGDHRTLVHLSGNQFRNLTAQDTHGHFCARLAVERSGGA